MNKFPYLSKYILEVKQVNGFEGEINLQNSEISSNLTDPVTVAIISAIAGAIAGAFATESIKALSNIDIFRRNKQNKQAERELVAISIIQAGKLIFMTKRNQIQGSNLTWCFPAARVKTGEIIEDRLKERYKEKFNIEINKIKKVGESYIRREDLQIFYFHCQYDEGEIENYDTVENYEVKWVDVNNVENLVTTRIDPSLLKIISKIRDT